MGALDDLVALLDLEQLEVNLFRGYSRDRDRVRLYGGEVLAQALMAAGRTVDAERRVHSMHAYFLKLGDPKIPVVYDVDRIRDGGSFTTRRVVAIQHGQAIFNLAASFQVAEAGPEHYDRMPEVADAGLAGATPAGSTEDGPETIDRQGAPHVIDALDFRHVGDPWNPGPNRGTPVRDPDQDTWFRTRGRLPDDPLLHSCVVAYASDLTLLGTATLPHPIGRRRPRLHDGQPRPRDVVPPPVPRRRVAAVPRAQPVGAGRRAGFATGQIFCADGTLAVSVAQEGLLRPMRRAR